MVLTRIARINCILLLTSSIGSATNVASAALPVSATFGATFETSGMQFTSSFISAGGSRAGGILATNGARVQTLQSTSITVHGLNSIGDTYGIAALDASEVIVVPTFVGKGMVLSEQGSGDTTTLFAQDAATISFSGEADAQESGNGSAYIARATDDAIILLGGSTTVSEFGNRQAYGVFAEGNSNIQVNGSGIVNESGNGDSVGIHATGNSTISFGGDYQLNETGNGDFVFAEASGEASIRLSGNLTARNSGNSSQDRSHIRLKDASRLDFVAGRLHSSYERFNGELLSDEVVVNLSDTAKMYWSGGVFDTVANGTSTAPSFTLSDASKLVIVGSLFNHEPGLVEELSGRITGILEDGSPFVFDFDRTSGARLILVPEPPSLSLVILVITLRITRRGLREPIIKCG